MKSINEIRSESIELALLMVNKAIKIEKQEVVDSKDLTEVMQKVSQVMGMYLDLEPLHPKYTKQLPDRLQELSDHLEHQTNELERLLSANALKMINVLRQGLQDRS